MLAMMAHRLSHGRPRVVSAKTLKQWFVYTDAAYEQDSKTGGLGAALFNGSAACVAWFGIPLNEEICCSFGADKKETIIYELELCASVLALDFWAMKMQYGLQVCFGDNDASRFSLIRGSCASYVATRLMEYHLRPEADNNLWVWFARVPTEANISDHPSRGVEHSMLESCLDESTEATTWFGTMRQSLKSGQAE